MTRRTLLPALLLAAGLGCSGGDDKKDTKTVERGGDKETVVELDDLKAKPPAKWKEEVPVSRAQGIAPPIYVFRLPRVEGDSADAEIRISKGISGTVQANMDRWRGQFKPPEGKKIDDVAKESTIKIGGHEATRLDISGSFKANPMSSFQDGYRMVGIDFQGPRNRYHIIFRGPAATVDSHTKDFNDWLTSFK